MTVRLPRQGATIQFRRDGSWVNGTVVEVTPGWVKVAFARPGRSDGRTTLLPGDDWLPASDGRTGRVRTTDPRTSFAGARNVSYRAGSQKARLLEAFAAAYPEGLTAEEAAAATGLPHYGVTKRCSELEQDGLIADSGEERRQSSGSMARVLVITEAGLRRAGR